MDIVNLTPHDIVFFTADGKKTIKPSGKVARVSVHVEPTGEVFEGIPLTENLYGEIEGLPDSKDGTIYIVSSTVAQRVGDRNDVFIPNESIRDSKGRIIGCMSLGKPT